MRIQQCILPEKLCLPCKLGRPCGLIKHPANTGFQYLENSFLSISAATTAPVTLNVYAVHWAILQLAPGGQLSVDNLKAKKEELVGAIRPLCLLSTLSASK